MVLFLARSNHPDGLGQGRVVPQLEAVEVDLRFVHPQSLLLDQLEALRGAGPDAESPEQLEHRELLRDRGSVHAVHVEHR